MTVMSSTLITVAPTGAETAKADVPALPTTLDEILAEARACQEAGAAVIHVHVRDREHRPTLDPVLLAETVAALRDGTDLVVQLSTGGSVRDSFADRLAVLDARPDSCSLTCGTTNFGEEVFANPWGFLVELYRKAQDLHVVPEFELFELGHARTLERLIETCGLPWGGAVHADWVLGVPGALPGTVASLMAGVAALPEHVTSWSATGIGRSHLPVAAATLALGGHLRVGMEDTLWYARGRAVRSNEELVLRAARLAEEVQRPVMSREEGRRLLGLPAR